MKPSALATDLAKMIRDAGEAAEVRRTRHRGCLPTKAEVRQLTLDELAAEASKPIAPLSPSARRACGLPDIIEQERATG